MDDVQVNGSGNGAADPSGLPLGASPEAGAEWVGLDPQAQDRSDFEARLRSEPDFAVEQVKNHQRRAQELTAKLRELEPLAPWAQQLGGAEGVLQHLSRWSSVLGNPEMRRLNEEYIQTGRVPTSAQPTLDPYADPPEPDDPRDLKIRQLEDRLSRSEGIHGKTLAQQHLQTFFTNAGEMPAAVKGELLGEFERQVRLWDSTPQGREQLSRLDYQAIDLLLSRAALKHFDSIAEHRASLKRDVKQAAATEAAPVSATPGRGLSPKATTAVEAAREAARRFGVDLDRPTFK